jgi:hypothetical protein
LAGRLNADAAYLYRGYSSGLIRSTYMALAAFVDSVRSHQTPLNSVESALTSTLVPIMATRAIYEKRIVTWEEVAG